MKFIVQTDQYTQTNTRTHMHARIRTQTHVPECLCPPLPFLKTTLTLLFSPFLHAQRHAWQAQLNRDPTERPNCISLASLCRTGSPKPIKTSVAMHVTVLSMCSVQDKTCVIVPCSGKKNVEGIFCSHWSTVIMTVGKKNRAKGSRLMSKQAQFIPSIGLPRVTMLMVINGTTA